jgi:hypothetical protein
MSRKQGPCQGQGYRARKTAEHEGKPVPKWAAIRDRSAPAPKAATSAETLAATEAGTPAETAAATPGGTAEASRQVPFDATLVATRKRAKSLVSPVNQASVGAVPDALAGAVQGALGHPQAGTLTHAVTAALISGPVTAVGAGLMAAKRSLVLGLARYLLGPCQGLFGWTLGESAAKPRVARERRGPQAPGEVAEHQRRLLARQHAAARRLDV